MVTYFCHLYELEQVCSTRTNHIAFVRGCQSRQGFPLAYRLGLLILPQCDGFHFQSDQVTVVTLSVYYIKKETTRQKNTFINQLIQVRDVYEIKSVSLLNQLVNKMDLITYKLTIA